MSASPAAVDRRIVALALAPIASAALGLGRLSPSLAELVGVLSILGLLAWSRRHVARRDVALHEVALALGYGLAVITATFLDGHGARLVPDDARARAVTALALLEAAALALLWRGPWLLAPLAARAPSEPSPPASRHGAWVVVGAWLLVHGAVFVTLPPLLQVDSACNLWEPDLLREGKLPHHPPLYTELVKLAVGSGGDPTMGLTWLVLGQHLLVLAVAVTMLHVVRRAASSEPIAVAAGALLAIEPQVALYAQSVMSDVLAMSLVSFAAALLLEAQHRPVPARWLLAAGVCAATATLTRQACQGWLAAGVVWLLLARPFVPLPRALGVFALGALGPFLVLLAHNGVFAGRATLTAATGRNLVYRAVQDAPPLTDPAAPPGDRLERARRITWEERERCWLGPYTRLRDEEGWPEEELDGLFTRFYLERIRREPLSFTTVTLGYARRLLVGVETFDQTTSFHDQVRATAPRDLDRVPPASRVPRALQAWSELGPTSRAGFLLVAALSLLVGTPAGRRASLLALGAAAYFLLLAAAVQPPITRYRLPAVPFLVVAAAATCGGALARVRREARS